MSLRKIMAAIIVPFCLLSPVNAEPQQIEVRGEYEIGSRDTREDGKKGAIADAMRNAMLKAGIYIESYSEVHELRLSKDEIKAATAGIIKVLDEKVEYADNGTLCIANIVAVIDIEADLSKFINKSRTVPEVADPKLVPISDIDEFMNKTITVRGHVVKVSTGKGNIYFTLEDVTSGKTVPCVLFAKTNRENVNYRKSILSGQKNNAQIRIKATVSEYKGTTELKVWQVYAE